LQLPALPKLKVVAEADMEAAVMLVPVDMQAQVMQQRQQKVLLLHQQKVLLLQAKVLPKVLAL
jgi:hypothetical protein